MSDINEQVLDNEFLDQPKQERRRKLIPKWIMVFVWIFMFFGVLIPFIVIAGLFGFSTSLSLYGLESFTPFSLTGILIVLLFLLKGIVAFSLWFEKDWAVNTAILDAGIGIILCIVLTFAMPYLIEDGIGFSFRAELILLIPYIWKMSKITEEWAERAPLQG